jgi:ribosome-associated heat shock protein Hsp15
MSEDQHDRMDKFLWNVRIFKTRALATEACKKGRVTIGGMPVKPGRNVKPGEIIGIRKPPVNYSYQVLACPKSRLSAKLLPGYITDLTPQHELGKLLMQDDFFVKRDRGTGRPTKKERRTLDKLKHD